MTAMMTPSRIGSATAAKTCLGRFDDLTSRVLAGHHQLLRVWVLCLLLHEPEPVGPAGRRGTGPGCLRRAGNDRAVLANVQQATIKPIITDAVAADSLIHTDEYSVHARLQRCGYQHKTVCHAWGEYTCDGDGFCEVHVNTIKSFWSLLLSWLRFHGSISQEKLPTTSASSSSRKTPTVEANSCSEPLLQACSHDAPSLPRNPIRASRVWAPSGEIYRSDRWPAEAFRRRSSRLILAALWADRPLRSMFVFVGNYST